MVVNEIIRWGVGECIFFMIVAAILVLVGLFSAERGFKPLFIKSLLAGEKPSDTEQISFFLYIVSHVWAVAWFLRFAYVTYFLIFILCAPRLYILQKLAELAGQFNGK